MIENVYELSPLQEGIYYHWLADDSSSLYFEQVSCRVRAQVLDIEKLKGAYDQLTARHAVLRTSFSNEYAGRSLQIVRKEVPSNFSYERLDRQSEQQALVETIKQQDRDRGFDLSRGSQMRLHVIDLSEGEYEFVWSYHHILMDGWCLSVLINDFNELLSGAIKGNTVSLPPVMPYSNYINWLKTIDRESSLSYWKDYLKGYSSPAEIPFKARAADSAYMESSEHLQIRGDLFKKVDALCTQLGITHNTFVQGVWGYLLSRYNNTNDVVFGAVVSGRPADLPGVEEMIGLFINTIPVRVQYDPAATPVELLKSLQEQSIQSTSHHYMNLAEVQSQSELGMELMNHIMVFENYAVKELESEGALNSKGEERLSIESMEVFERTNYDFNLLIASSAVSLQIGIRYNTKRYDATLLKHLVTHFDKLISEFAKNPDQSLRAIDYLSEAERHELLFTFNDTAVAYPQDKTIVDLFEEQVSKTPDHVAVVFEETELTYRELNERSNQLAHYLRENYDIQADDLIGIKQERSEWMIISILGVLKAGGAYVPIDPDYPQERIEYIEQDTQCKVCVDERELSKFKERQERYFKEPLPSTAKANNLVYVIYTSGSTGNPKGVMIEHGSLLNLILHQSQMYDIQQKEKILLFAKYTFDPSLEQQFLALCNGAALVVLSEDLLSDTFEFAQFINQQQISHLDATPSFLETLTPGNYISLKRVISGGEACNEKLVSLWSESLAFYNAYGPTETTVTATITSGALHSSGRVTVGKPLANLQIYLVGNENLQLVPIGVVGEICIGGAGLARGYLNQETLTQEKFIPNPFKEGERLYKTGDLGRWLPDGNLEFIGRKDDQVKIRGYRIELGEIEYALLSHEEIEQSVVLARENESGEKELVAYVIASSAQNVSELRDYLKQMLPVYMVPAYLVQLEAIPLTSNGKVDKKSLPDPEGLGLSSGVAYVAPRTELEEKLVKIWEEVLQREKIGVNDDFFALGGHSLKAVRLSNEYQKELSAKLSFKELFAHTSVASHAILIASLTKEAFVQIEKVAPQASYAISDGQRRLWVLSQFEGGSAAYNTPESIYLNQDVKIESFRRAIDSTIERHEILRTVFREDDSGEIRQWVLERKDLGFAIDYQDFSREANKQEKAEAYIAADAYRVFDLAKGPLLRAALLQVAEAEYVFYFNMHHIISDAWSMEVLSKDVLQYYEAYKAGKEPSLEKLRIQYKDYSAWQLAQLKEEASNIHRDYWLNKLSDELPLLDLPGSKQRPKIRTNNGGIIGTYLCKELTSQIKKYSQEQGGSLFMGLLASLYVVLNRYTSQKDIIIGSPITGREHADLEDQIGFYLNTLALRNEVNPEESFEELFSKVKRNTLEAYSHQMYPFDRLVEELNLQRDTSRSAVFDVMLVLRNDGQKELELTEEQVNKLFDHGSKASKFDILFDAKEVGDYIYFSIGYNTDIYDKEMIAGLIRYYKNTLEVLLSNPKRKISHSDYLSEGEKRELLVSFNNTKVEYPKNKTVVDMFEEQVNKTPATMALVFEENELTYCELDEQSNQLANYLKKIYNVLSNDIIGIKQDRNEWFVISILGVLKAGCAYVPIDKACSKERNDYFEKETKYKVCIDENELSKFRINQKEYSKKKVTSLNRENDIAYVIYTSGSTGQPKGIVMGHDPMANLIQFHINEPFFKDTSRVLQCAHTCFDAHFQEIFTTLTIGATLFPISDEIKKDPRRLSDCIIDRKLDTLFFPTALFRVLMEDEYFIQSISHGVKNIQVAGEQLVLGESISALVNEDKILIHNHYGPSETHVVTTFTIGSSNITEEGKIPAIGRPIANTNIFIMTEERQLVPKGVVGELYIGGKALAKGYLNNPGLTAEKFITNPFDPEENIYRTGDLARWRADGNIEYIGRRDDQVKIRGYRVELGEIYKTLMSHDSVKDAVVLTKESSAGDKRLVAYVVLENINSQEESVALAIPQQELIERLRKHIRKTLPDYMMPAAFVLLKKFPMTINGKLDRRALQEPDFGSNQEYVAPRTELEKTIVLIWQEVLGVERVGVTDDFFRMGGNSISAIKVISRINKLLLLDLTVKELFLHTTIELFCESIKLKSAIDSSDPLFSNADLQDHAVNEEELYDTLVFQSWRYLAYRSGTYKPLNLIITQELRGIDQELLCLSVDTLVSRHESLRTLFLEREGKVFQKIVSENDLVSRVSVEDICEHVNKEAEMKSIVAELQEHLFDFEKEQSFICKLIRYEKDRYLFVFVIDHIISDAYSLEIIEKELLTIYDAYYRGIPNPLQPLKLQLRDYVRYHNQHYTGAKLKYHQSHFDRILKNIAPKPTIKLKNSPSKDNHAAIKSGGGYIFIIPGEMLEQINKVTTEMKISFFNFILAGYSVFLSRISDQTDFIIDSPMATRNTEDLSRIIGWVAGVLVLRVKVNNEETFRELLLSCKNSLVEGMDHIYYQYSFEHTDVSLSQHSTHLNLINVDTRKEKIFDFGSHHYDDEDVYFDFAFKIKVFENGIVVNCSYKRDVIDKSEISMICEEFVTVLKTACISFDVKMKYWE